MGNGCQCTQPTTKENNVYLQIENPKTLNSEITSNNICEISKLDTNSNGFNINIVGSGGEGDNKEALNPLNKNQNNEEQNQQKHLIVPPRKRPKTSMPRHSTFLNRTTINISIIGDKQAGKTSFMKRFCQNKYDSNYKPSTKDELMMKKYPFNSRYYEIRMNILNIDSEDTDYSNNDFIIMIYDINNKESVTFAKNFFKDRMKEKVHPHENGLSSVVMIANKADNESVSTNRDKDVKKYCNENKIAFFKVSVKDNIGIESTMQTLIEAFDNDVFKFVG